MKDKELIKLIPTYLLLFLMITLPEVHALAVSETNVQDITSTSSRITWQTDIESDSAVNYGLTNATEQQKKDTNLTTNHTITLTGLAKDTKYYYSVQSNDTIDSNGGSYYTFNTLEEEITPTELTEEDNQSYTFTGIPSIQLSAAANFSKENNFTISGTTSPNVTLRFFINDHRIPEQILDTGQFSKKSDMQGKFNATIQLLSGFYNGTIGLNVIKVESTSADYHRNYAYQTVIYDAMPPQMHLNAMPSMTNQQTINVTGSTSEPATITITINNVTQLTATTSGENNIFNTTASLMQGNNTLEINATDLAGQSYSYKQKIILDTTPPTVTFDKFDDIYHFTIATFKGNTSEPNVKIKVTNTGTARPAATDDAAAVSRVRTQYNVTNVTTFRFGRQENATAGTGVDILGGIVGYQKETTSNEKGEFSIQVGLINGTNNLVFEAIDEAGNAATASKTVSMITSSGYWKIGKITTLPNEVYTDSMKTTQVDIGITYELFYLGTQADDINSLTISAQLDGRRLNNNLFTSPKQTYYYWNAEQKKMTVYQEIDMLKYDGDPQALPDRADMAIVDRISYRIGREEQHDEKVFYETGVSIEKPLKYSKFLTPSMINKSLEALNKTIGYLNTALKISEYATYAAMGACLAVTVYNYLSPIGKAAVTDKQLEHMFLACDRVLCPYVPDKCDTKFTEEDQIKIAGVPKPGSYEKKLEDGSSVIVEYFDSAPPGCPQAPANYHYVKYTTTGTGNYSLLGVNTGGANSTPAWYQTTPIRVPDGTVKSINTQCLYTDIQNASSFKPELVTAGCYNPDMPNFDKTKCIWNYNKGSDPSMTDLNPYDDIITSARCGCITGVRGNLENIIRILEGIRGCLQQAYIGQVRGGYCERLIAQFTCDWISWAVKQLVSGDWLASFKEKNTEGYVANVQKRVETVNTQLKTRYGAIMQNRLGLSADQLVQKACIGAITGDWTDLTNLLKESTRVPVKPVIAPMMPESRVTAYNPFTGTIAINYLMTIGIMSGGQEVTGKVEIWCDPNYPTPDGQPVMCPERRIKLADRGVYIARDNSVADNWAYSIDNIPYWGNVAVLTLDYTVGGELQHEEKIEPIVRKGGLVGQCHWQVFPPMIVCETLMPGTEGLIEAQRIVKSPDVNTYYPGNDLTIKIDARRIGAVMNNTQKLDSVAVVYDLMIPAGNGSATRTETNRDNLAGYKPFGQLINKVDGTIPIKIFTFPSESQVELTEKSVVARPAGYPAAKLNITKGDKITVQAFTTPLSAAAVSTQKPVMKVYTLGLNDNKWTTEGANMTYTADENLTLSNITQIEIQDDIDKISKVDVKVFINDKSEDVAVHYAAGQTKTTSTFPESSNYKLTVTLWEDVDENNAIDPEKDKVLMYSNRNQSETMQFSFNPKASCEITPKIDIIKPSKGELFCKGNVSFTWWDDCNQPKEVTFYYSKYANETEIEPVQASTVMGQGYEMDISKLGFKENDNVDLIVTLTDNKDKIATAKQTVSYNSGKCTEENQNQLPATSGGTN